MVSATPVFLRKKNTVSINLLIGNKEKKFKEILEYSKQYSNSYYNCVVPVSGGKDSTWQVYAMKKIHKMRPLAITFDQFDQTALGKKKFRNIERNWSRSYSFYNES